MTFPQAQHIYGLPEHATSLSLPDTVGPDAKYSDPLRLHNCDIFEYEADSSMALYGAIPLLHAHSKSSSVGVLNLVGSETWVDVLHDKRGIHTHWYSGSIAPSRPTTQSPRKAVRPVDRRNRAPTPMVDSLPPVPMELYRRGGCARSGQAIRRKRHSSRCHLA